MSLPEVLLWRELRKRPQGLKFRRQHPAGPYILDFVCLQSNLAIEIDGKAHGRGEAPIHDEARDEWLANQGCRTLRISARDVLQDLEAVLKLVVRSTRSALPLPHRAAPGGPPPRTGEDLC